jgi:hypothetical protein
MVATIDSELLEFEETTGAVTGAGSTSQTPVTFTAGGDILPLSNQLLVRWSTNGIVHNRRVRGRTFFPGNLEANNLGNGTPAGALTTPVQTAINAMLTTMSGRMRVWAQPFTQDDPAKSGSNPTRPGSAHEITQATIAPFWAVLRSRRD